MQQNRGNNGNFYDLRREMQHPSAPSRNSGTTPANGGESRYGFNGEPLSFKPDRASNGTVRRTRTDNSIEFPSQPRTVQQGSVPRRAPAQGSRPQSGKKRRVQGSRKGTSPRNARAADRQQSRNRRLRPAAQDRDPVRRESRKKRRMTQAAIRRRRRMRKLFTLVTLLAVIAAGVYLTATMLFRIGTIEVQTADGTPVQQAGGYTSSQILQSLGVQPEQNIFSFSPAEKAAELERQYPLLESIRVERDYPNTVVVKVTEAVPTYAMQTQSGWLTLSDKFKILGCGADQPPELKTLYGGEPVSAVPGEQLSFAAEPDTSGSASAAQTQADDRLAALEQLKNKLEEYGMLQDVTRIEFADTDQMAFLYQDRISVLLGTLNDLDYKLERTRYVLTNADGNSISATDTGGLDLSHVSASGTTRKFYLAQGQPTLPSGYVVPEKAEEPAPAEDAADSTDSAESADAADTTEPAAETDTEQLPLTHPDRMTANEEENPM